MRQVIFVLICDFTLFVASGNRTEKGPERRSGGSGAGSAEDTGAVRRPAAEAGNEGWSNARNSIDPFKQHTNK